MIPDDDICWYLIPLPIFLHSIHCCHLFIDYIRCCSFHSVILIHSYHLISTGIADYWHSVIYNSTFYIHYERVVVVHYHFILHSGIVHSVFLMPPFWLFYSLFVRWWCSDRFDQCYHSTDRPFPYRRYLPMVVPLVTIWYHSWYIVLPFCLFGVPFDTIVYIRCISSSITFLRWFGIPSRLTTGDVPIWYSFCRYPVVPTFCLFSSRPYHLHSTVDILMHYNSDHSTFLFLPISFSIPIHSTSTIPFCSNLSIHCSYTVMIHSIRCSFWSMLTVISIYLFYRLHWRYSLHLLLHFYIPLFDSHLPFWWRKALRPTWCWWWMIIHYDLFVIHWFVPTFHSTPRWCLLM